MKEPFAMSVEDAKSFEEAKEVFLERTVKGK